MCNFSNAELESLSFHSNDTRFTKYKIVILKYFNTIEFLSIFLNYSKIVNIAIITN